MQLTIKKKIIIAIFFFFISALLALLFVVESVKKDFFYYTEGEREDDVYILTSYIETQYEKNLGFDKERCDDVAMLALSMGYEMVLYDKNNNLVTDTKTAIKNLLPLAKRRHSLHIKQYEEFLKENSQKDFAMYELFLKNEEIGSVYLRQFEKKKTLFFVERTTQFLLVGIFGAVISSFILGIFITSRILTPISTLQKAATDLSIGKKIEYIEVNRRDELGELAKVFNTMAKSLNEREVARKSSMSKFAHELRTPLAVIQGELEAMLDDVYPVSKESLKSILEEVLRLKKMVEALERLYKIEKEALNLTVKEVSLKPFLEIIRNRFLLKAKENNNSIVINCDDIKLFTDPDLLTQILYNLVDNALKATKNGSIIIRAKEEESKIIIDVIDTGIGIPEQDIPFIFERFYTKTESGLGIGLAVVKEAMEALGGEIKLSSKEGMGSTFTLIFNKNITKI